MHEGKVTLTVIFFFSNERQIEENKVQRLPCKNSVYEMWFRLFEVLSAGILLGSIMMTQVSFSIFSTS